MEKKYITIAIVFISTAIILLVILNNHFNKRLSMIWERLLGLAAGQAMLTHQIQEFIIEDLNAKSKTRDLSEIERAQFHVARKLLHEIEIKLKDVGYYKKSST